MSHALLFPGQAAQRCGMLHRLPPGAETERTLAEAAEVLGRAVPGDGPDALDGAEAMRTDTVELALLVAGTATARVLAVRGPAPAYCAGHSVGAFTAAVAAGVLDFPDAVHLVRLRAGLMADAYPPGCGYGMAALRGLSERRVRELAAQAWAEGREVWSSNVNAPDQITVSGSSAGIDRVLDLARRSGVRRIDRLAVPIPAHCPLMDAVVAGLADRLAELATSGRLRRTQCGWVGTVAGRVLRRPDHIARDLAAGAARPVRWHDMSTALYERGVRLFVETPPGSSLSRLAVMAFSDARAIAVDDAGLDSAVTLLAERPGP